MEEGEQTTCIRAESVIRINMYILRPMRDISFIIIPPRTFGRFSCN